MNLKLKHEFPENDEWKVQETIPQKIPGEKIHNYDTSLGAPVLCVVHNQLNMLDGIYR